MPLDLPMVTAAAEKRDKRDNRGTLPATSLSPTLIQRSTTVPSCINLDLLSRFTGFVLLCLDRFVALTACAHFDVSSSPVLGLSNAREAELQPCSTITRNRILQLDYYL